ncbi:MAG: hypothetical protein HOV83_32985 [Catenulispora sp.]|nr:hypothetical protein [Catenulispora sp.]
MPDLRAVLLPVYVLADESGSMAPHIGELNAGLASLHAALLGEPMACAKVRLTIMGFSDTVALRMHLADLRVQARLPELIPRTATNYGAAFSALEQQIRVDVAEMKAQQFGVHRPAVFFLSDGLASDGNLWWPIHERLTDRERTPGAPNIIAFGIGEAEPKSILKVATRPDYAFVSIAGSDVGAAVARFSTALTKSVIASGRSLAKGQAELFVERPEGFVMAIDLV